MPAIKYLSDSNSVIVSQHTNIVSEKVEIPAIGADSVEWFGFVRFGTAMQFKRGRIVKLAIVAVSAGDGLDENDWIELPEGHFGLGWRIPGRTPLSPSEVFGLIDVLGWPMTTLRYDELSGSLV
jgi:hypothetical protein